MTLNWHFICDIAVKRDFSTISNRDINDVTATIQARSYDKDGYKTNVLVSGLVRHKQGCTATEGG